MIYAVHVPIGGDTRVAKSYLQILQNIETLKKQAEQARRHEVAGVVARIREAIDFYGLTAADLGLAPRRGKAAAAGARAGAATARFRDADGNSWSGRGPRPRWLREALAAGHSLDEFRRAAGDAAPRAARKPRKAARKVKYRDEAGNTWGGMGKRPQWLRDALDAGKQLDDFLVARTGESTAATH
ncbi:MAG: H-NS family nucleoid-associated regulatory protein [Betaproteobacteria bacterium]